MSVIEKEAGLNTQAVLFDVADAVEAHQGMNLPRLPNGNYRVACRCGNTTPETRDADAAGRMHRAHALQATGR